MTEQWKWIGAAAAFVLLIYQQFRIYRIGRESKKREELFQIVTENAADMIALVDMKGRRLYNSPAYKRVLGYSAAELGETLSFEQVHPDDRFKVLEAAREARSTGVGKKLDYRIRHKDGTWRILESIASTIRDEKGEVVKLVIVNRDVTERKRAEEQLEHNSFHDALTGLPNRRLFMDRLQRLFARAQRIPGRQHAVLFVDVDGFKTLNDTMGPKVGDQVIIEIGRRLEAGLRSDDTVSRPGDELPLTEGVASRMGGDEFTILLEEVSDPSDAMRVAKRIISAASASFVVEGGEVRASASVGIALSAATHQCAEDLLQDADVAMRRAKALGGSRCEVFDEAVHTRAINRLKLEGELRDAVNGRQFRVYYQAIVRLEHKTITGFEAMLHWQHPEQGLIAADKFMTTAEDCGLLASIGLWMIQEACRQLRSWEAEIPAAAALSISVKVTAKQLAGTDFVNGIEAVLRETRIGPSRLHLEITESLVTSDATLTAALLSHVKRLGVGVILDNLETGTLSLMGSRQFPAEALKINRSLIAAMLADRASSDMVELIMLVAHKMKGAVIAEGIESSKQMERLRELGCEFGQGSFFSSPLDAAAAGTFLREKIPAGQAKGAGA
jgi:diguanylate cyclase (GGDEF)-like protein/PAS domain S-box-containing protein